jgi:glycosyltransferase involved in cell wall biosynthesis
MNPAKLAAATVWNRDAYRRLYALVSRERPEIVHFHNTFPLLSPACYYAAGRAGAAVVQTLHNYRLICPAASLLREGAPCEDCVGSVPWRGVVHACYRGSRSASAVTAGMLMVHRAAGTWNRRVDAYIALTEFSRSRFIAGGLPAGRLFVKPNFAADAGIGPGGDYFLFAGRLSQEKGLDVLLEAWRSRDGMPLLKIAGDGPLGPWLREQTATLPRVEYLGRLSHEAVVEQMKHAAALVLPSVCYENFPVSVVEAYAAGLPVIASDAGAIPELVHDHTTGLIFPARNSAGLTEKILELTNSAALNRKLRAAAREEFEACYQGGRNLALLVEIYRKAVATSAANDPRAR